MHEDLLGYLLGALEPEEMDRISAWLKDNPEGQRQLDELQQSLHPLEDAFEAIEPPSEDLLAKTMASIPDGLPPSAEESEDHQDGVIRPVESPLSPAALSDVALSDVALSDVALTGEHGRSSNRLTMMDSIGGLLSVATLLALLLPTIAAGRFESRKVACQDRLRDFGTALMQYVYRDRQGRLPEVEESGREAFAGIYAMRLGDAGLLNDASRRWCPSMDLPMIADELPALTQNQEVTGPRISLLELPPVATLGKTNVNELKTIQRFAGGHYAYNLGVMDEQGFASPRYEGRTSFAVMADAPMGPLDQFTNFAESDEIRFGHGGQGTNILYEDGRVRFIPVEALQSMPDHPLLNHNGESEAGIHIDDASLSPSWKAPFSGSMQR